MENVERLREIIQEIIATGAQVSDVKYVGFGVYQGVAGGAYQVTESQMVNICNLLKMATPSSRVWDREADFIICQPGGHSHSMHHK